MTNTTDFYVIALFIFAAGFVAGITVGTLRTAHVITPYDARKRYERERSQEEWEL